MINLKNEILRLLKESTTKMIVYHGSSDRNLKIRDNSLIWFTTNKTHADWWAHRYVLGGKEDDEPNFIYTAEITFHKPYTIGDSEANPKNKEIRFLAKNEEEAKEMMIEIFYDDVSDAERVKYFVNRGYDCFVDDILMDAEHYAIPSEYKNHIKWLNFEEMKD